MTIQENIEEIAERLERWLVTGTGYENEGWEILTALRELADEDS